MGESWPFPGLDVAGAVAEGAAAVAEGVDVGVAPGRTKRLSVRLNSSQLFFVELTVNARILNGRGRNSRRCRAYRRIILVAIGADRARCSFHIATVGTCLPSDTSRYVTIETGTDIWRAVAGIDRALNIVLCDAIIDALSRSGHVTCYRNISTAGIWASISTAWTVIHRRRYQVFILRPKKGGSGVQAKMLIHLEPKVNE